MNKTHLNVGELKDQISEKIGDPKLVIPGVKKELVDNFLESKEFDSYMQDRIHRWLIDSHLINARLQRLLTEKQFNKYISTADTEEGREALAASIVFASIRTYEKGKNLGEHRNTCTEYIGPLH